MGVDVVVILKPIWKEIRFVLPGWRYKPMEGGYEHARESLVSIKVGESLGWMSNC